MLTFKSGFDKEGSMRMYSEQNSKGQTIKKFDIEAQMEEKEGRMEKSDMRMIIEEQMNQSMESAMEKDKINPDKEAIMQKKASLAQKLQRFDGIRHEF